MQFPERNDPSSNANPGINVVVIQFPQRNDPSSNVNPGINHLLLEFYQRTEQISTGNRGLKQIEHHKLEQPGYHHRLKYPQDLCNSLTLRWSSDNCCKRKPPWKKSAIDIIISLIAITGVMLILHLKQRDSDQYVELDTLCLEDISVILCVLIVFNIKLMSLIYFRMYGYLPRGEACECILYNILRVSQLLFFIVCSAIILLMYLKLQNEVSFSDPLFSLYKSWMVNIEMVLSFLFLVFSFGPIRKVWLSIKYLSNCR
eukprot:XP_017449278.1 PREDICTED: selection and upkeep of intraepithelial T-cells protein 6-like isoform X1 [Rattus norvegicus]